MSGRSVTLRLPWPPSMNRIWRAVGGRIVLSAAARAYAVKVTNALPRGHVEPMRGRLTVWLWLSAPKNVATYDIANREKLLADCLTKNRIWLDDEQIDIWVLMRGRPSDEGYVDILIQEHTL